MNSAPPPPRFPIAVTGIGVVSPIGVGRERFWAALAGGASGIAPAPELARGARLPTVAAAVRDFSPREFITSAHFRRMDNVSRLIVAASRMALDDAGLAPGRVAPERVGVVVGSALGDIAESMAHLERVFLKGPAAASPMMFPNLVLNAPASYVAMEFGFTGVNLTVAQAEISGEQAIALGCDVLRQGRADVVLAGGADEIGGVVVDATRQARALSGQRGGPEWSSPYDAGRNGIVLGEGSAVLVLESAARARARGAAAYAEIEAGAGFGLPAPPYDFPRAARAAVEPLRRMLNGALPDLVCGSANSSRRLDACEIDLWLQLFGEAAAEVSVTSIKGAVGEFGAAGALSAAAACLALREQVVPPLCHLREPAAPLRFAGRQGTARRLDRALLCGLARGGAGCAMLLRRAA